MAEAGDQAELVTRGPTLRAAEVSLWPGPGPLSASPDERTAGTVIDELPSAVLDVAHAWAKRPARSSNCGAGNAAHDRTDGTSNNRTRDNAGCLGRCSRAHAARAARPPAARRPPSSSPNLSVLFAEPADPVGHA